MRCIDAPLPRGWAGLLVSIAAGLAACGDRTVPIVASPPVRAAPAGQAEPGVVVEPAVDGSAQPVRLPPPAVPRSMNELQLQFARRLVAASPHISYSSRAPDRLQAIPVLEVELHADGSVRRIEVLRRPTTGDEATALAIAAVRRAAPYGNVSRLPRPWKVVETFLFDDRMHFKPRTLDLE